ncbi:MAG: nitroreductase family protein [Cryomorphaceae bacterium]
MNRAAAYARVPFREKRLEPEAAEAAISSFAEAMAGRRSIRHFSSDPVPVELVRKAIEAAASAPSGANKQPWAFCIVGDPALKKQIRQAAEKEEYQNYHGRMSEAWKDDLRPIGTDHIKPFLEEAAYLIVIFKKPYDIVDVEKKKNYYVNESVGLAAGILLAALRLAGLATLTHTPAPMDFLAKVLSRPDYERAYLLIPVGFPHPDATVPDIGRKPVSQVVFEYL